MRGNAKRFILGLWYCLDHRMQSRRTQARDSLRYFRFTVSVFALLSIQPPPPKIHPPVHLTNSLLPLSSLYQSKTRQSVPLVKNGHGKVACPFTSLDGLV